MSGVLPATAGIIPVINFPNLIVSSKTTFVIQKFLMLMLVVSHLSELINAPVPTETKNPVKK